MEKTKWDKIRPYTKGDLAYIWENLREDDWVELNAAGELYPDAVEALVLPQAAQILTWDTEGGPVAVLGVTRLDDPAVGLIWAIASVHAQPRWRFAVKNTASLLDILGEGFTVLGNFKDSRNKAQIEWLKKLGFVFIQEHPVENDVTYLEFVRINK